jgi:formylglycine-generating enzyme required for sulfatase activity
MRRLVVNLKQFDPGIDAEQIADILWLAQQMTIDADTDRAPIFPDGILNAEGDGELPEDSSSGVSNTEFVDRLEQGEEQRDTVDLSVSDGLSEQDEAIDGSESTTSEEMVPEKPAGIPIRAAAARSLRRPIELERALRPLMRKVSSRSRYILDEVATAEKFAQTRVKSPVVKAEAQRWLDLAVVVEETSLTEIWRQTIDEFQVLLEHLGAFRDVRVWTMRRGDNQQLELFPRHHRRTKQQRSHGFKELIDPSGQRLILVLSDCTSVAWWGGQVHEWLKAWSAVNLVTVMQLLPQRMWRQGVLGEGLPVQLRSRQPVVRNAQWQVEGLPVWRQYVESPRSRRVVATFPVVTLEPSSLQQWARAVAGSGEFATVGVLFEEGWRSEVLPTVATSQEAPSIDAKEIVSQFRSVASPMARRLANLMAVAPLNLRVIELIQEKLLPDSRQMHVAEVFLGGLLVRQVNELGKGWFQFRLGVRRELRQSLSKPETVQVLEKVSEYITARLGIPMRSFSAFLSAEDLPEAIQGDEDVVAFAEVALDSLRQMGGQYAVFADQVSSRTGILLKTFEFEYGEYEEVDTTPQLQMFEFDILTFVEEVLESTEPDPLAALDWQRVAFTVATIEPGQNSRLLSSNAAAWMYTAEVKAPREVLKGSTVQFEMMALPGGEFSMGSDENDREKPIHTVKVPPFFMGKYPVTQKQWTAVSQMLRVNRDLEPSPSRSKGDDKPVERVSWLDAVEFCARLSNNMGREYRLPTEAEWEYACRAGTTTKYYFGDEMTSELANHGGSNSGTTAVGPFSYVNAFGLSDMHGNVWEWCMDHWHDNYKGAPTDGSAWIDVKAKKNADRILRGGSWNGFPADCCSASRRRYSVEYRDFFIGFRLISPAIIFR